MMWQRNRSHLMRRSAEEVDATLFLLARVGVGGLRNKLAQVQGSQCVRTLTDIARRADGNIVHSGQDDGDCPAGVAGRCSGDLQAQSAWEAGCQRLC